jgi:hypothetical protein
MNAMTTPPTSIFGNLEGSPTPTVDPVDLERAYGMMAENQRRNFATGADILARVCSPGADTKALSYRAMILGALVSAWSEMGTESPFAPYLDGNQLHAAVFRVAATAPLRWLSRSNSFPFDITGKEFFDRIRHESLGK